jgi:histidyl-tRNA synthetase
MKKQMGYANQKQIPFVAVIGGDEMANGEVTLKNMLTGEQNKVKCTDLISHLQ